MKLRIKDIQDEQVTIEWDKVEGVQEYCVYWSDKDTPTMQYRLTTQVSQTQYTLKKATHVPHFIKVSYTDQNGDTVYSDVLRTPVKKVFHEQLEKLNRGLVAIPVKNGIFLSWRLFLDEVDGYCDTGLTGTDFMVYRNGKRLQLVTESTNYLDIQGSKEDRYAVAPIQNGQEKACCEEVAVWDKEYIDIPIRKPQGGITPQERATSTVQMI